MAENDAQQDTISREPHLLDGRQRSGALEAAYAARMPVMLKGSTACGKSRFVEVHGVDAGSAAGHDCRRPRHGCVRPGWPLSVGYDRGSLARTAHSPAVEDLAARGIYPYCFPLDPGGIATVSASLSTTVTPSSTMWCDCRNVRPRCSRR